MKSKSIASLSLLLLLLPFFHGQAQTRLIEDGKPSFEDILQAEQLTSQCLGKTLSADNNQTTLSGNRMGGGLPSPRKRPRPAAFLRHQP